MPDYLDRQPDLNDPETVSAFDELPLWSAYFGRLLLAHVPIGPHRTVLDLGFGTGFPALELAQRLGPTCQVHAIDPWGAALERASLKAQVYGARNLTLHLGSAAALPFPEAYFDLIVSNLGVNNFDDPAAVLAECRRVAKPGARLALTTNLQGHMAEFYEVFQAVLTALKPDALEALRRHVEHRATIQGLRELFAASGFRLDTVHEDSFRMRFLDGSSLLNHILIRLGFLPDWKQVVPPEDREAVFTRLEAELNEVASRAGELALTVPMAYVEAGVASGEERSQAPGAGRVGTGLTPGGSHSRGIGRRPAGT